MLITIFVGLCVASEWEEKRTCEIRIKDSVLSSALLHSWSLALPLVGDNQTDEPQQQWPVAFREAISFTYLYIILLVPLAATAVLWTKLEPATAKTAC